MQIQELKINQEKELSQMRTDLREIKSVLSGNDNRNFGNPENETRGNRNNYRNDENRNNYRSDENRNRYRGENGNNNRRRMFRCTNCVQNKVFRCSHCFKCGSEEHRIADCKVDSEKSKNGN